MGTYPSALSECAEGTVLLVIPAMLLPCMTKHVILLACYLIISGPWNVFGEVPKIVRVDMEFSRRHETTKCPT